MARSTKRNKTLVESIIKTCWRDTKKATIIKTKEQRDILFAINGTLLVLEILDRIEGAKHKEFFKKRYLSLHNNMTQIEIANKLNICADTIGDYCFRYIQIFQECLDIAKKINAKSDDNLKDTKILEVFIKYFLFDI